ncbi:MAG: hypothetical protein V1929_01520 [bacterium]
MPSAISSSMGRAWRPATPPFGAAQGQTARGDRTPYQAAKKLLKAAVSTQAAGGHAARPM